MHLCEARRMIPLHTVIAAGITWGLFTILSRVSDRPIFERLSVIASGWFGALIFVYLGWIG